MSKAEGKIIAVKFTEPITGGIGHASQSTKETQEGDWILNGTYSGSAADIKDGNTNTYWQSRSTSNYVQINLSESAGFLHGFKVYCGSSYRPNSYNISISDDGVNFTQIATGSIAAQTGWQTFNLENYVSTNFIRINFGYTTRLYLYELILMVSDKVGGFKVTGQEQKYVSGPIGDKVFAVASIEAHPTEPRTIIITVAQHTRFNNAEDQLKISYDATQGTLVGLGGAVQSFDVFFTPEDLYKELNPNPDETIKGVVSSVVVDYDIISYTNVMPDETITASPVTVYAELEYVGIVNP